MIDYPETGQETIVIAGTVVIAGSISPAGPVGPIGPVGPAGPVGPLGPDGPGGPVGIVDPDFEHKLIASRAFERSFKRMMMNSVLWT